MNGLAEMNRQIDNIPYVQPAPLRELFVHSHWEEWMVDIAMDLLMKMLEVNPAKRITADEALRHPFFLMFSVCSTNHGLKLYTNMASQQVECRNSLGPTHSRISIALGSIKFFLKITDKSLLDECRG